MPPRTSHWLSTIVAPECPQPLPPTPSTSWPPNSFSPYLQPSKCALLFLPPGFGAVINYINTTLFLGRKSDPTLQTPTTVPTDRKVKVGSRAPDTCSPPHAVASSLGTGSHPAASSVHPLGPSAYTPGPLLTPTFPTPARHPAHSQCPQTC